MFPDAGPTARALLTLQALQSPRVLTAAALASRLGVSERAARRSVSTLREVGVPVGCTLGRDGGYRLGRGLRPHPEDPRWCLLEGTTNNPAMDVAERLAAAPVPFTVEGGTELPEAVRRLVTHLAATLEER